MAPSPPSSPLSSAPSTPSKVGNGKANPEIVVVAEPHAASPPPHHPAAVTVPLSECIVVSNLVASSPSTSHSTSSPTAAVAMAAAGAGSSPPETTGDTIELRRRSTRAVRRMRPILPAGAYDEDGPGGGVVAAARQGGEERVKFAANGTGSSATITKAKSRASTTPSSAKRARTIKKWDLDFLLEDTKSPLVKADIRAVLTHPLAWSSLTPEDRVAILSRFPDTTYICQPSSSVSSALEAADREADAGPSHQSRESSGSGSVPPTPTPANPRRKPASKPPSSRPDLVGAYPDVSSLRSDDGFRHDAARYAEDLGSGRHDRQWLAEAWSAHSRRRVGDFADFEAAKFEDDWDVSLPDNWETVVAPAGGEQQDQDQDQDQDQGQVKVESPRMRKGTPQDSIGGDEMGKEDESQQEQSQRDGTEKSELAENGLRSRSEDAEVPVASIEGPATVAAKVEKRHRPNPRKRLRPGDSSHRARKSTKKPFEASEEGATTKSGEIMDDEARNGNTEESSEAKNKREGQKVNGTKKARVISLGSPIASVDGDEADVDVG